MHSSEARKILLLTGFIRDTEVYSNENEYYIRSDFPTVFFIIPKVGNLSVAKEKRLLDVIRKIRGE